MPELPDIAVYLEALESRILSQTLEAVRIISPFLLRTASPPISAAGGLELRAIELIGLKRETAGGNFVDDILGKSVASYKSEESAWPKGFGGRLCNSDRQRCCKAKNEQDRIARESF